MIYYTRKELTEGFLALRKQLMAKRRRWRGNFHDGEDLAQDTYLRLISKRIEKKSERGLKGLFYGTAQHLIHDEFRHRLAGPRIVEMGSEEKSLEDTLLGRVDFDESEESVNAEQEMELFFEALEPLGKRRKEALILRKVYGYSQREIAAKMGISQNTVEQHLLKAVSEIDAYFGDSLWIRKALKRSED